MIFFVIGLFAGIMSMIVKNMESREMAESFVQGLQIYNKRLLLKKVAAFYL